MLKLILFDLDGTLLNTIEDLANSVNYALEQHHYPTHPVESFNFFVGNGVNKMLERALPESHRNADNVSMLKVDFIHHYFNHSETFTKPYSGIPELLNKLYNEGFKLGVASNKVHQATVELIKRFFPEIEFTAVLGQRDGYPIKPDGGILNEIISIAGVLKDEVMYVGDSGVDVATALNAKVQFTGVLWGFRPQDELEQVGASQFAHTTEELYQIIHS
jgi:phosphoglycolate phosphatase